MAPEGAVMGEGVMVVGREATRPDATQRWLAWLQWVEMPEFVRVVERTAREFVRAVGGKATAEQLRTSFAARLAEGGPVTRDEVAAWHRTTVRQVNRWMQAGKLQKLPGYGRRAMFDPRVASRLRPERKEG